MGFWGVGWGLPLQGLVGRFGDPWTGSGGFVGPVAYQSLWIALYNLLDPVG
jgi:hypothetical protein